MRRPVDPGHRVPWPRSLVVPLFVMTAAIVAVSVAAAVWMTVSATATAVEQKRDQTVTTDTAVYNDLVGYAATHTHWDAVGPVLRRLASENEVTLTLMDESGDLIATTAKKSAQLPRPDLARAILNPLALDPSLAPSARITAPEPDEDPDPGESAAPSSAPTSEPSEKPGQASGGAFPAPSRDGTTAGGPPSFSVIDPRAVGPFRLNDEERDQKIAEAKTLVACLSTNGVPDVLSDTAPNGRPLVQLPTGTQTPRPCLEDEGLLRKPTQSEYTALQALDTLVNDCLARSGEDPIILDTDLSWTSVDSDRESNRGVSGCIETSRQEQLASSVAEPARLFIQGQDPTARVFWDFSGENQLRLTLLIAGLLVLTLGLSLYGGLRLTRPLRTLAAAAARASDGDLRARADVRRRDEVGAVATAFNTMAERRETLESSRNAMMSDISHELRTPIATMRGWVEAAEDNLVTPDAAFLATLHRETLVLQRLVDDLHQLSLAEAGELSLEIEDIPLREFLDQFEATARGLSDPAGITLTAIADPALPADAVVRADPFRLRQALLNLVSNAVRHTPEGGRITISAERRSDATLGEDRSAEARSRDERRSEVRTRDERPGNEVSGGVPDGIAFTVTDTGSGIPAEEVPFVFDRFRRADKSRTRATGGSGLGLAIVREILRLHGGAATLSSTQGTGTAVTLWFPDAPPLSDLGVRPSG
ncbi:HAMP domain-containing protein [Mycetocola lacteus]|uniref:histidine kinase n=1 Tax=Mycetocola lacteus TaxID=76637 RepID=A0A3L7AR71_9MICO|nr:HAMP domain-containing sensor histidine kinase [Mycetocola lacteus]RLP82887.1 HAMP domain-containing protein [Mycetocola lacteus]